MEFSTVFLFAFFGGVLLMPSECSELVDVPGVVSELLMARLEELDNHLGNVSITMKKMEHRLEQRMIEGVNALTKKMMDMSQMEQLLRQLEKNMDTKVFELNEKIEQLVHRLDRHTAHQLDAVTHRIESSDHRVGLHRIIGPDGRLRTVYRERVAIDTLGQGWTVVQRRTSAALNFDRPWSEYRDGFGEVEGDHWLGLETIHSILQAGQRHELLVVLVTVAGDVEYAHYNDFRMADERDNYRLTSLGKYTGTAGDSLRYHEDCAFSTSDRDNDKKNMNCAAFYRGGWWFNQCLKSFLNGRYISATEKSGIVWNTNNYSPVQNSTMMIRSHAPLNTEQV